MDWMTIIAGILGFVLRHKMPGIAKTVKSTCSDGGTPAASPTAAGGAGSPLADVLVRLDARLTGIENRLSMPPVANPAPLTRPVGG